MEEFEESRPPAGKNDQDQRGSDMAVANAPEATLKKLASETLPFAPLPLVHYVSLELGPIVPCGLCPLYRNGTDRRPKLEWPKKGEMPGWQQHPTLSQSQAGSILSLRILATAWWRSFLLEVQLNLITSQTI